MLSEILIEALEIEPGRSREAFLREKCGSDPVLHEQYQSMIAEIEKEASRQDQADVLPHARHFILPAGSRIGPFNVIEKIGEGGFGLVYKAEQSSPIHREAALKVLRPGIDTLDVLRRFELERQVLSDLEHPGIARFYDAGSTAEGRPWVAMEYIDGVPIVRFCEEHHLGLGERIAVFQQACEAIQYAHLRGVIHRDLKPSNLLVRRSVSGGVEVKVIDFGVSRALSGRPNEGLTLMTVVGQLVGTPAYMSPEQARGRAGEVDIRTDVYAMGAILYEMLCGSPVISRSQITSASYSELQELIQNHLPERPSKRCRTGRDGEDQSAATARDLHGDLDWIVMKALEREKERRYPSIAALSEDLQAYLEKRPVSARAPSRRYLATRFVQRHRTAVISAGTFVTSLLIAVVVSTRLYLKEQHSREVADRETAKSAEVVRFLTNTLAAAGPAVARGRDSTMLREILQQTTERVDRELKNQPQTEAELRRIVGSTLQSIGQLEEGHEEILKAVAIHRRLHPEPHEELGLSLIELADSLIALGRFREGAVASKEAAAMWEELAGPDDHHTVVCLASYLFSQAKAAPHSPDLPELAESLLQTWRRNPGIGGGKTIPNSVATHYNQTGKPDKAIDIYLEEIENLRSEGGPPSPALVVALDNCGYRLVGAGRDAEAEPLLHESITLGDRVFEGKSPHADHVWSSLATIEKRRGNFEKQLEYARSAGRASSLAYPENHPYWREGHTTWGRTLLEQADRLLELAWLNQADTNSAGMQLDQARSLLGELVQAPDLEWYEKSHRAWIDSLKSLADDWTTEEALAALRAARESSTSDKARSARIDEWIRRLDP